MSIGSVSPFQPQPGGTVGMVLTNTAAVSATLAQTGDAILFTNATNVLVFVRAGGVATVLDAPVIAGGRVLLAAGPYVTSVSAIAAATPTGTVYATPGAGTAY